ncbi:MAG: hypothetical protein NZ936_02650 [Alphaproteobacteria bacterium]|nr:hypothetical protein [Alphaproteobacteria bacterium]
MPERTQTRFAGMISANVIGGSDLSLPEHGHKIRVDFGYDRDVKTGFQDGDDDTKLLHGLKRYSVTRA